MSLIINADGEYLSGSGGTFCSAGATQVTMAICVKRDSGSSSYQSYCGVGTDFAASYGSIGLAHNTTSVDCFVYPSGTEYRVDPSVNSNSTSWQWLVLTYEKDVATKVYTAIVGGSVNSGTDGDVPNVTFNNAIDEIRIGLGNYTQAGWFCRARLAHCAFWNTRLTAGEIADLVSGGSGGISKNPQAIQNANLTFYAPLTSDATVTVGGLSLSATGTITYDGADNPSVESYSTSTNVTMANVIVANTVSSAAIYSSTTGTLTTAPLRNNAGTLLSNETGATAYIHNVSTGALVVAKTGQITNASGVMTVVDALIIPSTQYRIVVKLASTAEGLDKLTAT